MSPSPSILVYGHDPLLLELRRLVLERAGFHVSTTVNKIEAQNLAATRSVDLVVLCHTLAPQDRDEALTVLSAIRPAVGLLLVTTVSGEMQEGRWETVASLAGAQQMVLAALKAIAKVSGD